MKIKFIICLLLVTTKVFALENKIINFKCDSGANQGQVKRWNYNKNNLIEIYPNGYKRVYDIKIINEKNILAEEDAKKGMYYVTISLSDNDIKVAVITPLVNYIDNNCRRLNQMISKIKIY